MDSKNSRFLRQGLIDRYRRMSPEQRVRAFIEHSKLMLEIRKAGDSRKTRPPDRNPGRG